MTEADSMIDYITRKIENRRAWLGRLNRLGHWSARDRERSADLVRREIAALEESLAAIRMAVDPAGALRRASGPFGGAGERL